MILKTLSVLGIAFVVFAGNQFNQIRTRVETIGNNAIDRYALSTLDSLHMLAVDSTAPFSDRNEAVWALGQIGSKKSLPVLYSLNTEEAQERPLDASRQIVRYTVNKSIRQIRSPFIATRWMYRGIRSE